LRAFIPTWVLVLQIIGVAKVASAIPKKGEQFVSEDKEFLLTYCKEVEQTQHHDFYIFGHRHLPLDLKVSAKAAATSIWGEWVHFDTYAVYDGATRNS
jgi:UDP-2,3-diacylglucosamine hydrolase